MQATGKIKLHPDGPNNTQQFCQRTLTTIQTFGLWRPSVKRVLSSERDVQLAPVTPGYTFLLGSGPLWLLRWRPQLTMSNQIPPTFEKHFSFTVLSSTPSPCIPTYYVFLCCYLWLSRIFKETWVHPQTYPSWWLLLNEDQCGVSHSQVYDTFQASCIFNETWVHC